MTLIELLKLDEASNLIHSLKLFMIRTDKKTAISTRDKKILNLLLVAERNGFMFHILNGKAEKYLSLLCSETEEYRWEPFTHEIIPFHVWFAEKTGKHNPDVESKKNGQKEETKVVSI